MYSFEDTTACGFCYRCRLVFISRSLTSVLKYLFKFTSIVAVVAHWRGYWLGYSLWIEVVIRDAPNFEAVVAVSIMVSARTIFWLCFPLHLKFGCWMDPNAISHQCVKVSIQGNVEVHSHICVLCELLVGRPQYGTQSADIFGHPWPIDHWAEWFFHSTYTGVL